MKLIRKIAALAGIICVSALFSACQSQTAVPTALSTDTGAELGLLYYTKTDNETTLTGFEYGRVALEIPAQIDGKDVVKIGDNAFLSDDLLTEIVLPESVKSVGVKAFSDCGKLKAVYYKGEPDSIEADKSAFDGSSVNGLNVNYTDDNVPTPNTYFCSGEFLYTENEGELTITGFIPRISIGLPDEIDGCPVTVLGTNLFLNETLVYDITLPRHLRKISSAAFQGCTGLERVLIPDSLAEIGDHAFFNCKRLQSVCLSGTEGQNGYADLTSVGTVEDWAFGGCESLVSVGISDSMTEISLGVFSRCKSLTEVNISENVNHIGTSAFDDCSSMLAINVAEGSELYCDIDGVLFNKAQTEILKYPEGREEGYVIPPTVTTIGEYALKNCGAITVPETVTAIKLGGLSSSDGAGDVYLPNSLEYAEGAVCTGRAKDSVFFQGRAYDGDFEFDGSFDDKDGLAPVHRAVNSPPFARQEINR